MAALGDGAVDALMDTAATPAATAPRFYKIGVQLP
jgi:hypothetical protein